MALSMRTRNQIVRNWQTEAKKKKKNNNNKQISRTLFSHCAQGSPTVNPRISVMAWTLMRFPQHWNSSKNHLNFWLSRGTLPCSVTFYQRKVNPLWVNTSLCVSKNVPSLVRSLGEITQCDQRQKQVAKFDRKKQNKTKIKTAYNNKNPF